MDKGNSAISDRNDSGKKSLGMTLLLASAVLMAGCDKGSSTPEPEVEESSEFLIQGSFFQTAYDPANAEALYADSTITGRGRNGRTNLLRWDLKTGENSGLRSPRDFTPRDNTGRLIYRQNRISGATTEGGNTFFMMGPNQGLTFGTRKPDEAQPLSNADLSGQFYCVRQFGEQSRLDAPDAEAREQKEALLSRRIQLLSMEFTGTGAFSYSILRDSLVSQTPTVGTSLAGSYEMDEFGAVTVVTDAVFPAGEADFVFDKTEEQIAWKGSFQKLDQFLVVSYMIGETEPRLEERTESDAVNPLEAVPSGGLLVCLKGVQGGTNDVLNGEYWFGRTSAAKSLGVTKPVYSAAFGLLTADGVGQASRVECQSSDVKRSFQMEYQVQSDGALLMTTQELDLHGVIGAGGNIALLMHHTTHGDGTTDMGIDLLMKKLNNSECPAS